MKGVAAAVCCSALLLSACSGEDPPPRTLPTLASSAPAPTAVATPSGINAPDAFGARAFARYWFAELNRAFASSDAEPIERLSDPGCDSCRNLTASIEATAAKGHRYVGLQYALRFAEASPPEPGGTLVDLAWDITPSTEVDSVGRVVDRGSGESDLRGQLLLKRVANSWKVFGFRRFESS
jgi:hypothetical protein